MRLGIIGSGWLAQAMAQAWRDQHTITLTTRNPEKRKQLETAGFNSLCYNLGDDLALLADIDGLIIATTSKDLKAHQSLLKQITQYPDLALLFTSSTAVYPNDGRTHTENSDQLLTEHPLYAIEQCLRQHPRTTVIRCGGLIGPGRHPGRFFRNKAIPAPQAPVNLLPLVDAIGVFQHVIEHNISGITVNACHNEHPSKGSYYPKMARAIGLPAPAIGQNDSPGKIVDTRRLTDQLKYTLQGDIWQIEE
ncbi:MAG: hypothetical protein DWP95_10065 [Proteobacteria bacterium]|nr:MAG: hypothetical protein DWP95_10065 [Pseudomonadota bacterium]